MFVLVGKRISAYELRSGKVAFNMTEEFASVTALIRHPYLEARRLALLLF